jgi:hypothetical protein
MVEGIRSRASPVSLMGEVAPLREREADELADAVGEVIRENLAEMRNEITGLKERVGHLEEGGDRVMRYAGTFNAAGAYIRGDTVSHSGSLWFCLKGPTSARPGDDRTAWVLVAKSGAAAIPRQTTAEAADTPRGPTARAFSLVVRQ